MGLVRPARRPEGWQAPGPQPAPPDDPDLRPGPDEDLCYLTGEFRILQKLRGHRWSVDDLLTAWLASESTPPETTGPVLDLGCGIGSVLLMLAWRLPRARLHGIEAQAASASMARRSARWNGVAARVTVLDGDLRALAPGAAPPASWAGPAAGTCPLVTGTPPYFTPGSGSESAGPQKGPCRFEHRGGPADYVRAAAFALAPGGTLVLCCAPAQRAALEGAAAAHGLTPTLRLDVAGRSGQPPRFHVFRLRAGEVPARPPADAPRPRVEATVLVIRDAQGQWTPEFARVRASMGLPPRAPR